MELNYRHSALVKSLHSNRLSGEQFTKFYHELKNLSPLQQQFWVVKDLQGDFHKGPYANYTESALAQINGESSISQAIFERLGTNTFGRIKTSGYRIIPTLSLAQAYLNARYEHSVKLDPIIGFGNIEDLHRNGLEHKRIVSFAFPFKGLEDFLLADGYLVMQDYDMFYHDAIYHGKIVSEIPPSHRIAFIILADTICEVCSKPEFADVADLDSLAEKCFHRLGDMEFPLYGQKNPLDPITCFFKSLNDYLTASLASRLLTKKLLQKKEGVCRKLTREEVEVIITESCALGSSLIIKLKGKKLMEEIGKVFIERYSKIVSRNELKFISLKLKSFIQQENMNKRLALIDKGHRNEKIQEMMAKYNAKYRTFSEAIGTALDQHFAR